MNELRCWAVGLLGLLLFAGGAASAEPAADALKKGTDYLGKGDADSAISAYTEAIRVNPKLAKAFYNRGCAFEKKGEKAKAEEDFARAKKLGYTPK